MRTNILHTSTLLIVCLFLIQNTSICQNFKLIKKTEFKDLNYFDNREDVKFYYTTLTDKWVSIKKSDHILIQHYSNTKLKNSYKFPKRDVYNFYLDFCIDTLTNSIYLVHRKGLYHYENIHNSYRLKDSITLTEAYYDIDLKKRKLILVNEYNRFNKSEEPTNVLIKIIETSNLSNQDDIEITTDGIAFSHLGDRNFTIGENYIFVSNSLQNKVVRVSINNPNSIDTFEDQYLDNSLREIPFFTKANGTTNAKMTIYKLKETFKNKKRNTEILAINDSLIIIVEQHKSHYYLKQANLIDGKLKNIGKTKFKKSVLFGKTGILMFNNSFGYSMINNHFIYTEIYIEKIV